jgi:deoxyribodipyrimidine photo-lyase
MKDPVNIFWFRRDLRLDDNVGFYNALKSKNPVLPIFIFDEDILDKLPKNDARLTFIYETLQEMRVTLEEAHESSIAMLHGKPVAIFVQLK